MIAGPKGADNDLSKNWGPRSWAYKTANLPNELPRSGRKNAKRDLDQIWVAENRREAEEAMDTFAAKYQVKSSTAVTCLFKDLES